MTEPTQTSLTEGQETIKKTLEFLGSLRGNYIMSQALYYAIHLMEEVPFPYQETSNLEDMKYIRDNLFHFPVDVFGTYFPLDRDDVQNLPFHSRASMSLMAKWLEEDDQLLDQHKLMEAVSEEFGKFLAENELVDGINEEENEENKDE